MIEIQVFDKHGKEVSNGDTIRWFRIEQEWQEEWDPFYRHQVGTHASWEEYIYMPSGDDDGFIDLPYAPHYNREQLCDLYNLPPVIPDDEFSEYVLGDLQELTKAQDEAGILEEISGFEIIRSAP